MTLSIQPEAFSIDTHKKRYAFHQKDELKMKRRISIIRGY